MFTGIVESIGRIERIDRTEAGIDIAISTGSVHHHGFQLGDSVSVSGVCLTVTGINKKWIDVHVSNETIARTVFGDYELGSMVNIERPVTLEKPLGGHLVSGHVDGIAHCSSIAAAGASRKIEFELSRHELGKFVAEKGSVAIDGVSMTVNSVSDRGKLTAFEVNVIPHTLSATTLGNLQPGDSVHIEVDMVARYVHRLFDCKN